MSRKRNRQDRIVVCNETLLSNKVFSKVCESSFQVLAIVSELALDAGFTSLDAVCESAPEIVEDYCSIAHTALRGLKKLKERDKNVCKPLH